MNALVLEENGRLAYKTVPDPEPDLPGSVLVKIQAAGICGSDIPRGFSNGAYHYPLIMGHEFSGVVADSPAGSKLKNGDRVTAFPLIPCHTCPPCNAGAYAQCEDYDYYGSRRDGAFAEYVWIPEENLFQVPDHTDLIHAALTEPCAVALHGVRKLPVKPGDTAMVFGGGPIGNLAAQWLQIRGCGDVYVADVDERKLSIAKDMGFHTVNSASTDTVRWSFEMTDGHGMDHAVEACGLPATYLQALQVAAQNGSALFMGNINGAFRMEKPEFSQILRRELTMYGTWNSQIVPRGRDDWTQSLSYIDHKIQVEPLISHTESLGNGEEIFRRMASGEGFFNKVILLP